MSTLSAGDTPICFFNAVQSSWNACVYIQHVPKAFSRFEIYDNSFAISYQNPPDSWYLLQLPLPPSVGDIKSRAVSLDHIFLGIC